MYKSHLVIGKGEVGTALERVLKLNKDYLVESIDRETMAVGTFDVLHIAFPYSEHFVAHVKKYVNEYGKANALVINHSSVPVGTTEKIPNAVHSPVRGVHPNLFEGLRTFPKYFGGPRREDAMSCFFGLIPSLIGNPDSRNTEALKLWDTTYYGWNILFEKEVHSYCEKNGLDFDFVYVQGNREYNTGYKELGRPEVVRPVLKHVPGKIGGHCVIPNARLLGGDIAHFLLEKDESF